LSFLALALLRRFEKKFIKKTALVRVLILIDIKYYVYPFFKILKRTKQGKKHQKILIHTFSNYLLFISGAFSYFEF